MQRVVQRFGGFPLAVGLAAAVGCVEPVHVERSWTALGRPASAEVWATTERTARLLLDQFPPAMQRVELTMSATRPDSALARLNAEAAEGYYTVDDHDLFRAVVLGLDYGKASEGDYDPTLGPVLRLYERARPAWPEDQAIDSALQQVGWEDVALERGVFALHFLRRDLQIDLDGILEGYAVDVAARKFVRAGSLAGLLRLGHHVYAWGHPPELDAWWVDVTDPRVEAAPPLVRVRIEASRGIGVSGAGGASDLVIDPRSGAPASSDVVVAIAFADSVADAVAVSRALLVGGSSRAGILLSERTRRVESVLLLHGEGEPSVLASASLQGRIELDPALSDQAPGGLRFLLPPSELQGRLD